MAYRDVEPQEANGRIHEDHPWIHFHVQATLLVFAPSVGSEMGKFPFVATAVALE